MTAAQGIALYPALLWKLYQLSRAPWDVPLRALTLCLACVAGAYTSGAATLGLVASGPLWHMLVKSSLLACGVYALLCFFLFTTQDSHRARRRAMWAVLPLAAAILVMVATTVAAPFDVDTQRHPSFANALFHVAVDLYDAYGFGAVLVYARLGARGAAPRLARGLRVASWGLAAMSVGSLLGGVSISTRSAGFDFFVTPQANGISLTPRTLLVIPGVLVFVGAVSYPSVATRLAAVRVWWQHLRTYHHLRPLWTALHREFPEDALHAAPAVGWRDWLSLHRVHRRYCRRVIECRDGLVRISPYLARLNQDVLANPAVLAEHLRLALRAHAQGHPVPHDGEHVAILVGEGGLDADARRLAVLSQALTPHGGGSQRGPREKPLGVNETTLEQAFEPVPRVPRFGLYRGGSQAGSGKDQEAH